MPASPEVHRRDGEIGQVEVGRNLEADDQRDPDGHIRVARKITVDLPGERQRAGPGLQQADRAVGVEQYGGRYRQKISKGFFDQAGGDQEHAVSRPVPGGYGQRVKLGQDLAGAQDGTGDQLREERQRPRMRGPAVRFGCAATPLASVIDTVSLKF